MPTREAVTQYGEVEYETVECDSCGNELPKVEADRFVIGDYVGKDTWTHQGDELEFTTYRMGWACPYCQDDPAGFPNTRIGGWFLDLNAFIQFVIILFVGITILVGVGTLLEAVLA